MFAPLFAAVVLMAAASAPAADPFKGVDANAFEGLARDDFAAWSYGWNSVKTDGSVKTLLMQTLYDTPTPFNGIATPVAYSIHTVAIDCAGKTVTYVNGANYAVGGAFINLATPAAARPWTDITSGFQSFAAQICATSF